LSYAREKEKNLYQSLVDLTNSKQNEIQRLIIQAVNGMQETLADDACSLDMSGILFKKKKEKKQIHFEY
jgi:hypothetical protein